MTKKDHSLKTLLTKTYFKSEKEDYFYMAYKELFTASHWIDQTTGEEVKLTHNIKAVYTHKMDQFKSFSRRGQLYNESHQTVADKLGISIKTVEEVAIPLLKRMGLIHIEKLSQRRYITTMYPLKHLNGSLINKKLHKHMKPYKKSTSSTPITYEQLKVIERNKERIKKVMSNMTEEVFILTKGELDRLRKPTTKGDDTNETDE